MNSDPSKVPDEAVLWVARLRFHVTTKLSTDLTELELTVGGRPAILGASDKDTPIRDAAWLVLKSGGHPTEAEAREFGEAMREALLRVAVRNSWGVNVGEDRATSSWGASVKEHVAREGWELRDNVHGLDVYREGQVAILNFSATGLVSRVPDSVIGPLVDEPFTTERLSPRLTQALTVLANSMTVQDQISRLVLSVAAVECLAQGARWTDAQTASIARLAAAALADEDLGAAERLAVKVAVERIYPQGVLLGMKRLLEKLGLSDIEQEWLAAYHLRSKLLHGVEPISYDTIPGLAHQASELAKRIVLAELDAAQARGQACTKV